VGTVDDLCGGGGGGLEHGVQFDLSTQGVHALVELGGGVVDEPEDLLDEDDELELELDFEVELDVGPVQSVTRVTV
jgi:hypothetical protein